MRELLFRGKRRDNGEWLEGGYFKHDTVKVCLSSDNPETVHLIFTDGFCDWGLEPPITAYSVDPTTVGQYTRISDEHLNPLFEGDICRAKNLLHNGKEELFTVEWYENGFYLVDDTGTPWHPCHLEDIENIGNIHDNPELLGGA